MRKLVYSDELKGKARLLYEEQGLSFFKIQRLLEINRKWIGKFCKLEGWRRKIAHRDTSLLGDCMIAIQILDAEKKKRCKTIDMYNSDASMIEHDFSFGRSYIEYG